jgi:hypothetical protein
LKKIALSRAARDSSRLMKTGAQRLAPPTHLLSHS